MGELRSKNTYYLHTQEDANEHLLYKGEVQKSASKSGIAVRFTGLEELTNVGPLGRGSKKRSSVLSPDSPMHTMFIVRLAQLTNQLTPLPLPTVN